MQPTLNVCAKVAYDGTAFHGFQVQAGLPTIQGALEDALAQFCQVQGRVAGAGRTDTGVHASGQVVAVQVQWRHSIADLQNAWNMRLPSSIAVREVGIAPDGFHPRFSATARTYRYSVIEGTRATLGRSPLTDRFALLVTQPLALEAMSAAAAIVVGEHDFATFGQPTGGESTVRRLYSAEWQVAHEGMVALDAWPGRRLVLTVTANGFLRNMVRNLVGTFLLVGHGEWWPAEMAAALDAKDRRRSAPPAPPNGLVLERVTYPAHLDPFGAEQS
jgi:tRNA pseudouridine38-40 synthase